MWLIHCNIPFMVVVWTEPTVSPRCAYLPVSLSPQPLLLLPNGLMNKVVWEGGRSYIGSETWTSTHDGWTGYSQYARAAINTVPNMAPSPRVIIQPATWWQVDYTELLPSRKGKSFVLTGIDILDTDLSLLYPMFLPNLPPGHPGLFCPLHQ